MMQEKNRVGDDRVIRPTKLPPKSSPRCIRAAERTEKGGVCMSKRGSSQVDTSRMPILMTWISHLANAHVASTQGAITH